tara:strand:+ start:2253 stop:2483 length:231 start_codon:yes stop_codon:yes gene_type:complete
MIYCGVTDKATIDYQDAWNTHADRWVSACGGAEAPYVNSHGVRILYVYNFAKRKHGFLDVGQDIVYETDNLLFPVR